MMKTYAAVITVLAFLSGCAGSTSHNAMLQRTGSIRVAPSDAPDHQFVVTMLNDVDFGYDPDVRADRERTVAGVLDRECQATDIVREQMIDGGRNWVGRSLKTYVIQVRCTRRTP